jgi:hypothetical protein
MSQADDRERGLPSLKRSKEQRRRALVFGRVRIREAAPQFWLWTAVFLLGFGVIYWNWSERELDRQKAGVMARQRAVGVQLEPRLAPLRDRVEAWTMELAKSVEPELVSPKLSLDALSTSKGIYLRLQLEDAQTAEQIRRAAQRSLHDGFTSCLFTRTEKMDPASGKKCFNLAQCDEGELCNDWGICSPPTQPFNLRLMYGALRLLSPAWTDELHAATTDYQVRVFERDLDKVVKTDVRIALELQAVAKYFTLVLDEPALSSSGKKDAPAKADAKSKKSGKGADAGVERAELRVQGKDHGVRVGIWDLSTGEALFRGRFQAGAEFVPMGRSHSTSAELRRAQQRQVNSCGIAADLRDRLAQRSPATVSEPAANPAGASSSGAVESASSNAASAKSSAVPGPSASPANSGGK